MFIEKKKSFREVKELLKIKSRKKTNEKEYPSFHVENVPEFIEALSSMSEVTNALIEGEDNFG